MIIVDTAYFAFSVGVLFVELLWLCLLVVNIWVAAWRVCMLQTVQWNWITRWSHSNMNYSNCLCTCPVSMPICLLCTYWAADIISHRNGMWCQLVCPVVGWISGLFAYTTCTCSA